MSLQKLSRSDLQGRKGRGAKPEYVYFMKNLKPGEGGRAIVKDEGAGRQTVKNRLKAAADEAGVKLKFLQSPVDQVVFEAVE
jgi:hypothetical protein